MRVIKASMRGEECIEQGIRIDTASEAEERHLIVPRLPIGDQGSEYLLLDVHRNPYNLKLRLDELRGSQNGWNARCQLQRKCRRAARLGQLSFRLIHIIGEARKTLIV